MSADPQKTELRRQLSAQHERRRLPGISAVGRRLSFYDDFYHWVLTLTWPRFFGVLTLAFGASNALFAGIYALQPNCISGARSVLDLFFFSVQTLGTIGYGEMHPVTTFANVVMSFQALVGILITALTTGLTFARFARPTARVLFSDKLVIAPRNGVPHLMFRMANWRGNQVVEAHVRVVILLSEVTTEGETLRRPTPLRLARDQNPLFALSWLVLHPIDESSPLHGEGALERLRAEGADIWVSVSGLDETIMSTIHARWRYTMDDVVVNARFADVVTVKPDGSRAIDFTRFQDVEALPPAAASRGTHTGGRAA